MSVLARRAAQAAETKPPSKPAGGLLARKAAEAKAKEAAAPKTGKRKVDLDIPRGNDPERCSFPGRTLRLAGGNGIGIEDEDPNWTDETVVLPSDAPKQTGRKLAIRVCPDCREIRGNGGRASCWCGSERDAVRLDGKTAKDQPVRIRKQTPGERQTAAERMRQIREANRPNRAS